MSLLTTLLSTSGGGGSYTDEQAQDAVGSILTDSATIDFTYDDAGGQITASTKLAAYAGGNSGSTQALAFSNGTVQDFTLTAATAFTLPDTPSSTTANEMVLRLTNDATGGYLPTFTTASGDVVEWAGNIVPTSATFKTNPYQENIFRFVFAANKITAHYLTPKSSGLINAGGSFLQLALLSFLGSSTVSKRSALNVIADEVQTTDATQTTLQSIPVELNTTVFALSMIVGGRSTGAESITSLFFSSWRRASSGNVVEIASAVNIATLEDSAGTPSVTTTVDTATQCGVLKVTGEASKTINWVVYTIYFKVTQ